MTDSQRKPGSSEQKTWGYNLCSEILLENKDYCAILPEPRMTTKEELIAKLKEGKQCVGMMNKFYVMFFLEDDLLMAMECGTFIYIDPAFCEISVMLEVNES